MLPLLTIFSLALTLVNGLAIPKNEASLVGRSDPAPLKLDFRVQKNVGNISARSFWNEVHALRHQSKKRGSYPETLKDVDDVSYVVDIYVGSDKQKATVVLDTGSSDLWISLQDLGSGSYDPLSSSDSQDTGNAFDILYGDGTTSNGEYYTDSFSFSSTGNPLLSSFQLASTSSSIDGAAGILGIGDKNTEASEQQYDDLPSALQKAGKTPKASYSLYLGSGDGASGSVIFGGIDTEKYSGELTKYPVDTSNGPGLFVNVATFSVDGKDFSTDAPFLLDSGTSLGFVPQDVQDYLDSIFNPTMVQEGAITYRQVSCDQPTDKFFTLDFGQNKITFSYADAISQQDENTCLLGFTYHDDTYILGDVFLRNAYVYYDLTDGSISLAQAKYTSASNIVSA